MDRVCYNATISDKSMSADEKFLFGGILNKGNNSFALSEPELAGSVQ
jgi:hypothetical protein